MRTIAYIAPEVVSLSETFVHQEIHAVEALGYRVLPFAVHAPLYPARESQGIAHRTTVLHEGRAWRRIVPGLTSLVRLGRPAWHGVRTVLSDMRSLGFGSREAWRLPGQLLDAARVAQVLVRQHSSHIHAHFIHEPTQIAMYASALTGIPFTCTAHGPDLFRHGQLLVQKARRATRLMTVSHYNKDWLEARGIEPERIEVVRCTAELGQHAPPRHRLRTGPYRIGALCQLVERKGIDDLLRALAMLIRSGCAPVKLLIAGEGPERLRLQVLADQLGIHMHVDFIGSLAHHAVAHWMRTLDLFVAPSKVDRHGDVDGIPLALMEAMSLGLPVVSTRVSGVPELVIEDQTGYLAEPASPSSLASQIDRAMAEPERARGLGRAARAHVRWEFGREVNLRRLVRHFDDAPNAGSRPVPLEEAA